MEYARGGWIRQGGRETLPYVFPDEQSSPLRIVQEVGAKEKDSLFQRAFILLLILFKSLS